ncbi:MAG: hypothetical protein JNL10_11840 [Verrucomicrobiales bacterium]|nr:hypothetical protein [Verrucomicrobiales bacterium]
MRSWTVPAGFRSVFVRESVPAGRLPAGLTRDLVSRLVRVREEGAGPCSKGELWRIRVVWASREAARAAALERCLGSGSGPGGHPTGASGEIRPGVAGD